MHLLQLQGDDAVILVRKVGNNVPPYAILSHTWGGDDDEVSFDDVAKGKAKDKIGYRKIEFCSRQAAQDGLEFFWIDTCCIDKSSSAELSEAINSMFRWYRNAAKCYVYLSDISSAGLATDCVKLQESRWFTRGWTLQELIAPNCVEFYSTEGCLLGDKSSRVHEIAEITSISTKALLREGILSDFSVEERMRWASNRETTREEDQAYSLLGIFGIFMSPIYGEGRENAFKRLRKEMKYSSGEETTLRDDNYQVLTPDARLTEIHQWLSPPDASSNYHKALKQRQADTGLWFLQSDSYIKWKKYGGSWLWLYGIPGCGKTILSSTILEDVLRHCDTPGQVVAYFYFDFNDVQKQQAEPMLRSLLWQLSQQSHQIASILDLHYSSFDEGRRQPSIDTLLRMTRHILQKSQVYIILDALDECAQRVEVMDILRTIAEWQLQNVHLIATSRRERGIESILEGILSPQDCICLEVEVVDHDIKQYVRQRLSNDKSLSKWGKDINLWDEIETALMRGSKGMFRWAVCQLDTLGKCRNRAMLRKSLATLPPTLDKTYDQILSTIPDEDSAFAMRILQWLAFSERPLSVEEVAEVIAMDITRSPVFVRDEIMEDPLDTLDICSSLVTVVTEEIGDWSAPASTTQVVVLAHYSVKEYLVSDRIEKGQAARYSLQDTVCHSIIAQGCLSYLCQFQNSEPMDQEILQQYKLAHYSAEFWIRHTKKTGELGKTTSKAAMHLLAPEKSAYLNWIRLWDPERSLKNFNIRRSEKESLPPPLYYAALHGIEEIVNTLLHEGADVNAKGPIFGSALQAALFGNHGQVVKILLDAEAEVNAQDGSYGNALQIATGKGDYQMVKLLLDKGADVNAWTRDFLEGNPLQIASEKGNRQIVQLLLDNGADVNAQSGFHGNALNAALSLTNGDDEVEETVKILIEAKIDVNVQGGFFGNALQEASHHGYKGVVKRLLEAGARVNTQGGYYGNALQAASYWHYKEVVKMLLIAGANVNAPGGEYGNALQAAASRIGKEGEEVVEMLLAAGAYVNAKGGRYGSALQAASYWRFKEVMRRLLVAGANVYALGGEYGSPIEAAFLGRYDHGVEESEEADEILKMLFDAAGRILVHIE